MSKDIFARRTDEEVKRIDQTLDKIMELIKTLPTDFIDDLVQEIADEGYHKIVGQCCCWAKEHGTRKE